MAQIASIIAAFGARKLTASEKRKLLHWYQQLDSDIEPQLSEEEEKKTEKKMFQMIMGYIDKHPNP